MTALAQTVLGLHLIDVDQLWLVTEVRLRGGWETDMR